LGIFYGHFGILRPFVVFYRHLVYMYFSQFSILVLYAEKNLATLAAELESSFKWALEKPMRH
jgi:hypothetical protein